MIEELQELGLTRGEIAVYMALLRIGPSTNSPLARQCQLQSSSVYYCLNSLIEKGFVSYSRRGERKVFNAIDPQQILEIIDNKQRQFEEQKKRITAIIPQLVAQQKSDKEPTLVEVYEGHNGLQMIFNQILSTLQRGESYEAFVIEQALGEPESLRIFLMRYNKEVKRRGIGLRLLAPERFKPVFLKMYGKEFLGKYQEIRYTKEVTPVGITIYRNNVVTHVSDQGKPLAFRAQNEKLAKNYRDYFNDVWKRARP